MISRIDVTSHTTKAPTGLTITRKDNDITFKWKIADKNYGQGQQLQWRVNTGFDELGNYTFKNGSWKSVSITKTATSKTVSVTLNNYRPNTSTSMHSIEFRVRGLRSDYNESRKVKENGKTVTQSVSITCSWSPWVSEKMVLALPRVPNATATFSDTYDNRTTFSWNTSTSNTDNRFFRDVQYQSCLIKDSGSVGAAYDSKFGNTKTGKPASGTVPIAESTEDTTTLAQGSYTRWFRFRARGSKGPSAWKYVKHTYAEPFQAIIEEATLTGNKVYVKWTAPSSSANPIDKTTVKYAIATPNAGMVCPQGASWNEADISKDTKGTDAARFTIETLPGVDEVLYVKVTTTHDRDDTDSPIEIVQGGIGPLADPTNLSVSTDDATHKAIITATNNSSVPDSFLAIIYRTAQDPESDLIVGVIPHGSSSVTVQCPDWDEVGEFGFGVYAVAGTYTSRGTDYGNYEIDANMTSAGTLWQGGAIPVAPTNVTVNATEYAGTVKVAWTWAWSEANEAEISWSEDPLAWESTSEPNTYEVSNMHASQWYISGLETGTTWYIRVRLLKVDGDSRVEGPYSKVMPIDLSSAPSVPVLVLSAPVITVDGEVTASWAYSSTDGTDQAYAEITTAEINASGVYYGRYELSTDSAVVQGKDYFTLSSGIYTHVTPSGTENPASLGWYEVVPNIIAHTETAQHVTINAAEQGWTAGETYNLCVRVVSASGRMSDSWSDPVGVTVAEPLTATITQTSLADYHVVSAEADTTPYLFRPSPALTEDYDRLLLDQVVGGTLAVNQLFNFATKVPATGTVNGVTFTKGDGILTVAGTATADAYRSSTHQVIAGHKYFNKSCPQGGSASTYMAYMTGLGIPFNATSQDTGNGVIVSPSSSGNSTYVYAVVKNGTTVNNLVFRPQITDLTQMFGSTIADYAYNLEQSTAGSGVAWLKQYYPSIFNSYLPYNTGELMSVEASAHVMRGFNQFNLEDFAATYPSYCSMVDDDEMSVTTNGSLYSTGVSVNIVKPIHITYEIKCGTATNVNMRCVFEDGTYTSISGSSSTSWVKKDLDISEAFTNSHGNIVSVRFNWSSGGTFSIRNVCINVSAPEKSGTYERYVENVYPLDSGLVLRGIPKISNGVPYYDGDEYKSDGSVTRKYGVVDLGTLTWTNYKSGGFNAVLPISAKSGGSITPPNAIASKPYAWQGVSVTLTDGMATISGGAVYIVDANFTTDATAFKQAMSGVYLIYELATPTTETADPYVKVQECYKDGTEEFVADNVVPVGHKTEYAKAYDVPTLTDMPLTVTITGAGDGGTTTLAIERAETYHVDRPDETQFNGYEGETIALVSQTGESEITIDLDTLIGSLDDGAAYRLVATVQDSLGQSAEATLDFGVHWTHQAAIPTATVEVTDEARIAEITPIAPFGADPTDVCDIYRLSADRPQLIVEGGEFGTTYVDPYPTIGEFGGHRVVTRTANGDYITEDQRLAWTDLGASDGDTFWTRSNIIDFDGNVLECDFNNEIKNTFEKDFQETAYLGGAIQGDWNPIVRRTGSVDATFVLSWDPDTVKKLRALAAYTGICHIRTKDGSSYAADVQVDDNISYNSAGKLVTATLSITRVDPEGYEGMSKADWEEGTS